MASKIKVDRELDLHGMTIEAALQTVSRLVRSPARRGGEVVRLIHGHSNRGEDSIKTQVTRMLTGPWMKYLQDVYPEPKNPGATLIVLESP